MKEGRNKQCNINGKPIGKVIFSGKIFFSSSGFLDQYKIDVITKIDQYDIDNNNRNNTDYRPFGCFFRPGKFFIEKTVQQSISSSQYKSVQQGNKYG